MQHPIGEMKKENWNYVTCATWISTCLMCYFSACQLTVDFSLHTKTKEKKYLPSELYNSILLSKWVPFYIGQG